MPSQSVDPRTGAPFGPVIPDATAEEVRAVCAVAAGAAAAWGDLPASDRAFALRCAADALDGAAEQLVPLADQETGLGVPRLSGELARTTFTFRLFADAIEAGENRGIVIDHADASAPPVGHPDLRRVLVPLGPVAVFGASNFPFAFSVAGGDTVSALAAGCPVVAKAHPAHPQLSAAVAALVSEALVAGGAPEGTFSLVHGLDAGRLLVTDPSIRAAGFTGSGPGGRALLDLAMSRPDPIPFYGELGSVNPVFITPAAADRESLAADYLDSLLMGGGQFCTNPGLLLVPEGSDIVARVLAAAPDRGPAVLLHRGVAELFDAHCRQVSELPGITVAHGEPGAGPAEGFTRLPLLFTARGADVLAAPEALSVECFGPAGVIVTYASDAEAVALAEQIEGCLAAAVHGEADEPLAADLVRVLARRAGRVIWDGWPTGVAVTGAQNHGGPHPSTTNALHTSVGTTAMRRFVRPVAYQSMPANLLPPTLRD